MLKALGAQLLPGNLQVYFEHPHDPNVKIYVFLDTCHMIKLVWKNMSNGKILKNRHSKAINLDYLVRLQGCKNLMVYILQISFMCSYWLVATENQVNLAAKTLNLSVADALQYCEGKLKLPQFQGCGPTVQFICVFNCLFNVLNSRNSLVRNFKATIRKSDYEYIKKFLDIWNL